VPHEIHSSHNNASAVTAKDCRSNILQVGLWITLLFKFSTTKPLSLCLLFFNKQRLLSMWNVSSTIIDWIAVFSDQKCSKGKIHLRPRRAKSGLAGPIVFTPCVLVWNSLCLSYTSADWFLLTELNWRMVLCTGYQYLLYVGLIGTSEFWSNDDATLNHGTERLKRSRL